MVRRLTISNRYTSIKRVGTVVQLPCPETLLQSAGKWAVLALDLHRVARAVLPVSDGEYRCLKSLTIGATLSIRAAFMTETVYSPETLPRDFLLPLPGGSSFDSNYEWLWLPAVPPVAPPVAAPVRTSPPVPKRSDITSPSTGPSANAIVPTKYQEVRKRRAASGAAPRALFKPAPPPAPTDPNLLELSRVLGFSGEKLHLLVWLHDGRRILYASAALLILQEIDSAKQKFLMGHTADICAISAAESTPLVASAQAGPMPIIRLWDRDACVPLAILQQHESDMHCLSLTADGALLAAVGKDRRGHQLLAVWDVTQAAAAVPSCPLLDAKVSLVHIKEIEWVPADPLDSFATEAKGVPAAESVQLITCGYENVRFWRLRRGKLHACGMELQHEEDCMFLSIAIDDPRHGGGGRERQKQRRMLVGGSNGRLFVINPTTRALEYVHALHDDAINAVHLSAGFAVTGGADRKLRVWPLDFSAHFLEAEHEGAVTAIHASPDGLKLLIGTDSGTIGVLDVPTLKHATIVRSHTDIICGLAIDPHNREFATASNDGSIRVWELDGNQAQLVEFEMPSGCSRAVAYHPTEYAISCGFDDGSVRVFDIASTSLLEEYTQHHGKVVDLAYSHGAERLYSAGTDGVIVAYDVLHSYQPSRSYSATPSAQPSPCLALTKDDALLVAGSLQPKYLLIFEASTLSLLRAVPVASDVHAVAIGPGRTLFMAAADGALSSMPLAAPGAIAGSNTAPMAIATTAKAHKAAVGTITLARNGKHVVSGSNDRLVKIWPEKTVREGGPATISDKKAFASSRCQPYAGHSDHVTRLVFSSDGATLISVGGGDAIFLWKFK